MSWFQKRSLLGPEFTLLLYLELQYLFTFWRLVSYPLKWMVDPRLLREGVLGVRRAVVHTSIKMG